jgi:hypothetical protein
LSFPDEEDFEKRESEPDFQLTPPPEIGEIQKLWTLNASKKSVLKDWEALCLNTPADAIRCYKWLSAKATTRYPKRCFPLKGKKFSGHWEYEVGPGTRIFYKPYEDQKMAVVWYAGKHPKTLTPDPPKHL